VGEEGAGTQVTGENIRGTNFSGRSKDNERSNEEGKGEAVPTYAADRAKGAASSQKGGKRARGGRKSDERAALSTISHSGGVARLKWR